MNETTQNNILLNAGRIMWSIASIIIPIMLFIVKGTNENVKEIDAKLDGYGNRITAIEISQKAMSKDVDRLEVVAANNQKDILKLKDIYFTEIYPRFYGK